jgi:hypothetical protein
MCQVTPFTLPCCQRIYVLVEKLPNCPADWPKSKCPQELCIQIIDVETAEVQQRSSGTCWRCRAAADGKSGGERDNMRPQIDRAIIVEGLEELDATGRRMRVEVGGNCWYCGARHGCLMCGTKETGDAASEVISSGLGAKRRGPAEMGVPKKKTKVEGGGDIFQTPSSEAHPSIEGLSEPTLREPRHKRRRESQYRQIPNSMHKTPRLENEIIAHVPRISEDAIDGWQAGRSYTGNGAFWESLNSNQRPRSTVLGSSQKEQDIAANPDRSRHPLQPDLILDPRGTSRHDQASPISIKTEN